MTDYYIVSFDNVEVSVRNDRLNILQFLSAFYAVEPVEKMSKKRTKKAVEFAKQMSKMRAKKAVEPDRKISKKLQKNAAAVLHCGSNFPIVVFPVPTKLGLQGHLRGLEGCKKTRAGKNDDFGLDFAGYFHAKSPHFLSSFSNAFSPSFVL